MPDSLAALGPDPGAALLEDEGENGDGGEKGRKKSSSDADHPAGMRNLGATCYVAAVLQCLYALRPFRAGVYAVAPGDAALVARGGAVGALQALFARLQAGGRRFVDPNELVKVLQLDADVQQDGHEFMKLLLGLLERALGASQDGGARALVPNLFHGLHAYRTQCLSCGRPSDRSRRAVEMAELELNVQGFETLEDSLHDWCAKEKLDGDNAFYCENCASKQPATRGAELYAAPAALCVQLKRFVFDLQTLSRKKVTSAISFPLELDLADWITPVPGDMNEGDARRATVACEEAKALAAVAIGGGAAAAATAAAPGAKNAIDGQGQPPPAKRRKGSPSPWLYDLHAVLIHKGGGTSSGHYVAKVRRADAGSGWWQFDDEGVLHLGDTLYSGDAVNKSSKGKASKAAQAMAAMGRVSSSQGYMLMYVRRGANAGAEPAPPPVVAELVRTEMQRLAAERSQHADKVAAARCVIEARRAEVRRVLALARLPLGAGAEVPFRWVSAAWLKSWADAAEPPGVIDNAPLLCEHGRVPPVACPRMKRVTVVGWEALKQAAGGGGPELSLSNRCEVCMAAASVTASAAVARGSDACAAAKELMRIADGKGSGGGAGSHVVDLTGDNDGEADGGSEEKSFLVSKRWAKAWAKRAAASVRGGGNLGGAAAAPAKACAGLLCEHGLRAPNGPPAVAVPAALWRQLKVLLATEDAVGAADAPSVPAKGGEAANSGGGAAGQADVCCIVCDVPADTRQCPDCATAAACAEALAESAAAAASADRQVAPSAAQGRPPSVGGADNLTVALLPGEWVTRWREFLNKAAGRRAAPEDRPPPFDYSHLLCEHGGLLVQPPALVCRQKVYAIEKPKPGASLVAVPEAEGRALAARYPSEARQKSCDLVTAAAGIVMDSSAGDGVGVGCMKLLPSPAVCEACAQRARDEDVARRADFESEKLSFRMISKAAFDRSQEAPTAADRAAMRRRSRKTATLVVSSGVTLRELALAIMADQGHNPRDQVLLCDGVELLGPQRTLRECRVTPESELEVIYTEDHRDEDVADLIDGDGGGGSARRPEGFAGTALAG